MMNMLSMTDIWDETRRFVTRELALLLPLGLATFGMGTLLLSLVIPEHAPGAQPAIGPWMLWMIPAGIMVLTGYLAISAIALHSRLSVAEALGEAMRLLPRALILTLIMVGLFGLAAMAAGLVGSLISVLAHLGQQGAVLFSVILMIAPLAWLSVRLAVLWPALADPSRAQGSILSTAFRLTRGHALQIAGLMMINMIAYTLLSGVLEIAGGSVLLIIARLIGQPGLGPVLVAILLSGFNALYAIFWSVLLVRLYVALSRD